MLGKLTKSWKYKPFNVALAGFLAYESYLWRHTFDCRNTKHMQVWVFFSMEVLGFLVSNSTEHNLLNEFMLHKYYTMYSTEMRILQQKSTLMLKLFCIINLFWIFSILALAHGWQAAHMCHQDRQGLTPPACLSPSCRNPQAAWVLNQQFIPPKLKRKSCSVSFYPATSA